GWIENVSAPAFTRPLDELFAEYTHYDQRKLQEKVIVFEPQEAIGAANDWKRTEPEHPRVPPQPADDHVECIRERDLRQNQRNEVIDRPPVPSPVRVDR